MSEKPKHFLVFKILSIVFLIVTVIGFGLVFTGFGDFGTNNFMIGGFMSTFGVFATFVCFFIGFKPELAKLSAKSAKYIQQETKEDMKDIATTGAQISEEAVKTTARAVKEGLRDTKYCKHCGAEIDEDSRFCKECGKEQ